MRRHWKMLECGRENLQLVRHDISKCVIIPYLQQCVDSFHWTSGEIIPLDFDGFASPGPMRHAYSLDGSDEMWHDWRTGFDYLPRMGCDFFIGISLREVGFEVRCLWSYNANGSFLINALRAEEQRHPPEGESWKSVAVKTSIPAVLLIEAVLTIHVVRNQGISLVGVSFQSLFQLFSCERLIVNEQERPECSQYLLGGR
jgi:hypothetical protein